MKKNDKTPLKKEPKKLPETRCTKKQESILIQKQDWKFTQTFGDANDEKVNEEDIISAIAFDTTGRYLTLGGWQQFFSFFLNTYLLKKDNAGRIILFEQLN